MGIIIALREGLFHYSHYHHHHCYHHHYHYYYHRSDINGVTHVRGSHCDIWNHHSTASELSQPLTPFSPLFINCIQKTSTLCTKIRCILRCSTPSCWLSAISYLSKSDYTQVSSLSVTMDNFCHICITRVWNGSAWLSVDFAPGPST